MNRTHTFPKLSLLLLCWSIGFAQDGLSVSTFRVDATPPIGSALCVGGVEPAKTIVDPLSARGVVLMGAGAPIVLVAVDWVGIGNEGLDAWRAALSEAAGTNVKRVSVHTLHQHDAPGFDLTAARFLAPYGLADAMFDAEFGRRTIQKTARAVRDSMKKPQRVTSIGLGRAKVEQVASNRRVLGPDGKVKYVRYSATKIPEARAEPEGVIDPDVRVVSFWNGARPVVAMTFYATHPQSYYGKGGVSADFVGMARSIREAELPGVFHVHFNGASGNVTAGKYNDGAPENRPILARRLAAGMKAAWEATKQSTIEPADIEWRTLPVALPLRDELKDREAWNRALDDAKAPVIARIKAALNLAWIERLSQGRKIDLACLKMGSAYMLDMPGELFVEYQLAAQQLRPKDFVAMAAYGDFGPGYIGTSIAYSQGGYEPTMSRTAPEVEQVLRAAMRELLR